MNNFLLAALLPSNMTAEIVRVQRFLFRRFHTVAALALPPLVPFAWLAAATDLETLPEEAGPDGFRFGSYEIANGHLVARLDWLGGRVDDLRRLSTAEDTVPFPPGTSVLISPIYDPGLRSRISAARDDLPPLPAGLASVYRLACIEVAWCMSKSGMDSCRYTVLSDRWIRRK